MRLIIRVGRQRKLFSFGFSNTCFMRDCSNLLTISIQLMFDVVYQGYTANEGECVTVNGYYVETAMCTILGIVWFGVFKNVVKNLQTRSQSSWLVNVKEPIKENDKNIYTISVKLQCIKFNSSCAIYGFSSFCIIYY